MVEEAHEKLISKEIFLKVNEVENRNAYGYTTTEENDSIPLKRFLRCETCGCFLRVYLVKSKGIHYYKCNTKGCNCNRNAEELHGQFTHILNQYSLNSASLAPLIKQQTLATYYKLTEEGEDDTAIYESRLKEIDYNIERQKTRLKKEELPYKFYLEFEADFQKEKKKIQEELTPGSKGVSNPELCVEFAVTYSTKLAPVWSSASYTDKQSIQFLLFPEGIFYNRVEDSCRTTGVNDAFAYIAHQERLLQKSNRPTSLKNFESAALVVPAGIEPKV